MPKNPHADFAPALEGYSGQGTFRFWCQMALPLTYDDSLSYYELLCKVVNYLNNTIEDVADAETNVSRLAEAYTQLQNYVNDYFDDLDIEAELRNVLDAMAEDGTLDDLLDPLVQDRLPAVVDEQIDDVVADQIDDAVAGQIGNAVSDQLSDVVADQIDAVVAEQIDESVADQIDESVGGQINDAVSEELPPIVAQEIPGEVTGWLNNNVDPVGSAVVVDSSLTITGAAADAKVTGDELADLKTQLSDVVSVREDVTEWTDGYINDNVNVGQEVSMSVVTNNEWRHSIVSAENKSTLYVNLVGGISPRAYAIVDSENKLISRNINDGAFEGTVQIPANAYKIILNDKKSGGIAYTKSDDGRLDVLENTVSNLEETVSDLEDASETLETDVEEIKAKDENYDLGDYNLALRTNKNTESIRKIRNEIDESLSALLEAHSEGETFTITLPAIGEKSRYLVRVGLHYGSALTSHDSDEIFFDGDCRTDFSDVRFYDSNGNMLKAEFGKLVNLDLMPDNRLKHICGVLSDGRVLTATGDSAINIYSNNMGTSVAIPNTQNVTEHGSDVYGYKSLSPLYVDANDNIFAYAGGHLYKLLSSDNYATITDVLDFTWVNSGGVTVYPDAQFHSIDKDTNGNLIFGTYAKDTYFHTDIYRSADGGNTWSLCWHNYDGEYQHVHHVHADKWTGAVYVGVDDGSSHYDGGRILKTTDGGITWTDLTDEIMATYPTRGKDFYPTYCGNGYRLGSAESYIMGSATIYRSTDDKKLDRVVGGTASARQIVDFNDDSLLIAGTNQSIGVSENHILVSTDQGKTWDSIFTKYQTPTVAAGIGFRRAYPATTIAGDTEQCVIIPGDIGNVASYRLYKGGNHWYREAFILLENVQNTDITITVKTGYMIGYPFKSLRNDYTTHLAYRIPLDEGAGKYIHDNLGGVYAIDGVNYKWDIGETGRYGDIRGKNDIRPFEPKSGLWLGKGTKINLGKKNILNFSKSYTITCWFNTKAMFLDEDKYSQDIGKIYNLFDAGSVKVYKNGLYYFVSDNTNEITDQNYNTTPRSGTNMRTTNYNFTDQYYFLVLSVGSDNVCTSSIFGQTGGSNSRDYGVSSFTWRNLSVGNIIIGSDTFDQIGYLSDIRIYDKAFTLDEAIEMYRGFI